MIHVLGYIAALLTTGSAVPQLVQTIRTRDVRGISIPYWMTLALGVFLWLVYGLYIGSGPLIAANAVSFVLDISVLALTVHFRATEKPGLF